MQDLRERHRYLLRAGLPDVEPEHDVTVNVGRRVLTVETQRSEEKHEKYLVDAALGAGPLSR